jgi:mono/diheme cytochrome c family protein
MPDMSRSVAVETYDESRNQDIYPDKMASRTPSKGSIPYAEGVVYHKSAYKPYHHPFSPEGEKASDGDVNPIEATDANLAEGKRLYNIYCSPCHGAEGNADGTVTMANNRAFPMGAPFSYFTEANMALTEGHMFYITQYGRNSMGSYASQLNVEERWRVIKYVKKLQADYAKQNSTTKAEEKKDEKK